VKGKRYCETAFAFEFISIAVNVECFIYLFNHNPSPHPAQHINKSHGDVSLDQETESFELSPISRLQSTNKKFSNMSDETGSFDTAVNATSFDTTLTGGSFDNGPHGSKSNAAKNEKMSNIFFNKNAAIRGLIFVSLLPLGYLYW
jgi:hypothetical protein